MDFVMDRIVNGRRFKCLTMVDKQSKECPVIEVDYSINGERVCRVLERVLEGRIKPEILMMDNGPEFQGKTLDAWAFQRGIKLQISLDPGNRSRTALLKASTISLGRNV